MPDHQKGTGVCARDERLIRPHIAYTDAPERCEPRPSWTLVSYEQSLTSALDDYIAKVLSQVVEDVPANTSRALLPEDITNPILKRSARIGKIRHLRIL